MKERMNRQVEIERLTAKGNRLLGRARGLVEREKDEVARPKFLALVGTCYKYKNSYGSGEKWPLYVRIVSLDKDSLTYRTVQFQSTSRQHIEMEYRREYSFHQGNRFGLESGWQPISEKEYNAEKAKLLRFVKQLLSE